MKRIEDIDKNLKNISAQDNEFDWYDVQTTSELCLHGVFHDGVQYRRLPDDIACSVSDGVAFLSKHTAGGRVRFQTCSPSIAVRLVLTHDGVMSHMPACGSHSASVYCNGAFCGVLKPSVHDIVRAMDKQEPFVFDGVVNTPLKQRKTYNAITVCMPLYCGVYKMYIGVKKGYDIRPADKYTHDKPVVFYGSSITQGGCASHAGAEYIALLSNWLDFDYINLGFSGSGRAEPQIVEYLASLDASVFVIDYDHNAPNPEHLQATHYPLYARIREKNPQTPILFLTKPDCDNDAHGAERRKIIRTTYNRAKKQGDANVYFIDGKRYYGKTHRDICAVDGCHPTDLGFCKMAKTILPTLKNILE